MIILCHKSVNVAPSDGEAFNGGYRDFVEDEGPVEAPDRKENAGCDLNSCDVVLLTGTDEAAVKGNQGAELSICPVGFGGIFCEYCHPDFFLRGAEEEDMRQVLLRVVTDWASGRRWIFVGDPPDPVP